MKETFSNKVSYYAVTIVVIIFVLYALAAWTGRLLIATPSYEENPDLYQFIAFPPSSGVEVYSDKSLSSPVGRLERGIIVFPSEMEEHIAGVNYLKGTEHVYGYVSLDSFTYLPPANDSRYIQNMQEFYASEMGAEIEWTSLPNQNGLQTVTYTYEEDDYARSKTFIYDTDGTRLLQVRNYELRSGVAWAAGFIYAVPFFILLLLVSVYLRKRIIKWA